MRMKPLVALWGLLFTACSGAPPGVTPVDQFQLGKYLGTWYEIARLDHSFERGLTRVTADYSMREDGMVRVVNRGYLEKDGVWKEAEGKATFVGRPDQGHLKVSFFGPFYGSYIIFELDREGYQYALVCGPSKSYLWVLARSPHMDGALKKALLGRAASLGFETERILWVAHPEVARPAEGADGKPQQQ